MAKSENNYRDKFDLIRFKQFFNITLSEMFLWPIFKYICLNLKTLQNKPLNQKSTSLKI